MVLLLLFVLDAGVAYVVDGWLVLRLFVCRVFLFVCVMLQNDCVCLLSFGGCLCVWVLIFVHWMSGKSQPEQKPFLRGKIWLRTAAELAQRARLSGEAPLNVYRLSFL